MIFSSRSGKEIPSLIAWILASASTSGCNRVVIVSRLLLLYISSLVMILVVIILENAVII